MPRSPTEKAIPYMPSTPQAEPTLRRLAALKPKTIALMHGPAFKGDGAAALIGAGRITTRSGCNSIFLAPRAASGPRS